MTKGRERIRDDLADVESACESSRAKLAELETRKPPEPAEGDEGAAAAMRSFEESRKNQRQEVRLSECKVKFYRLSLEVSDGRTGALHRWSTKAGRTNVPEVRWEVSNKFGPNRPHAFIGALSTNFERRLR